MFNYRLTLTGVIIFARPLNYKHINPNPYLWHLMLATKQK